MSTIIDTLCHYEPELANIKNALMHGESHCVIAGRDGGDITYHCFKFKSIIIGKTQMELMGHTLTNDAWNCMVHIPVVGGGELQIGLDVGDITNVMYVVYKDNDNIETGVRGVIDNISRRYTKQRLKTFLED